MAETFRIKIVEVGTLDVKQQPLPGFAEGSKVPFERELMAGTVSVEKAVDMAMGALPHTYHKNQVEVRVSNTKFNRWETCFAGEGTSEVNDDEVKDDEPKAPKLSKKEMKKAEKVVAIGAGKS